MNQTGASLETFAVADVSSVVVTDAETLTITLTEAKRADLAGTSNFGGSSAGADGLDIEAGFCQTMRVTRLNRMLWLTPK